ncbi:MAG: phosphonate ABC transporter, permease protein PhnE [Betaproteobacteria bacterium]|nr:phosphonate ABC transporter, permease protein PhnE [Betaproteobacteria bacterium]
MHPADINPGAIAHARSLNPGAFGAPFVQRLPLWSLAAAFLALTAYCFYIFNMSPLRLWAGMGKLVEVVGHMFPPTAKGAHWDYAYAMLQTVGMAFLGTVIAAVLAVPLGFACARNMVPGWVVRFFFRRSSDVLRGVDQLIWALIFVRAVGLGPLAGILAIIISDTGTLAKLYSEAIENIDRKPVEGVRASGATPIQTMRFGVLPQVLPIMLSNVLYIFESNTRSATILGIVGAGGIGFFLADRIRTLLWEEACFILLLILGTVYLIDWLSKRVRARLIGSQDQAPALH